MDNQTQTTNGATQERSTSPVDRVADDIASLRSEFRRQTSWQANAIKVGVSVAVVTVGGTLAALAANAIINQSKGKLPTAK